MEKKEKSVCIMTEQEECLHFHYRNPHIYLQLKSIALREYARGTRSLSLATLFAALEPTARKKLQDAEPRMQTLLDLYRALLETDYRLWNLFRNGG